MAFHKAITLAQIANDPVRCPRCEWCGLVKEAIAELDSLVLCPRCETPVERVKED